MHFHFLTNSLENDQHVIKKEEEMMHQDQTQAADETQTQSAEEPQPMTLHLTVNCKCLMWLCSEFMYQQEIKAKKEHKNTVV